jgi:hypothetical protein
MRRLPALTATVLAGVVAFAAAAPATGSVPHPGHATITHGSSKIKLSKSVRRTMAKKHFTLSAISPSTYKHGTLTSPVKSGSYSFPSASVNTGGGFKISHGGKTVSITKFQSKSSAGGGSGTAVVTGHGRIKAVTTSQPDPSNVSGEFSSPLHATGFTVTLAKPLVKALDSAFNTTLFKKHSKIGTGSVTFYYK